MDWYAMNRNDPAVLVVAKRIIDLARGASVIRRGCRITCLTFLGTAVRTNAPRELRSPQSGIRRAHKHSRLGPATQGFYVVRVQQRPIGGDHALDEPSYLPTMQARNANGRDIASFAGMSRRSEL
jgi:hypothetical protein